MNIMDCSVILFFSFCDLFRFLPFSFGRQCARVASCCRFLFLGGLGVISQRERSLSLWLKTTDRRKLKKKMTDEPQAKKAKVTQRSPLVRTSSVHHVAPPNRLIEDLSFYFVLFIVICHFFSFSFSFPFLFFSSGFSP